MEALQQPPPASSITDTVRGVDGFSTQIAANDGRPSSAEFGADPDLREKLLEDVLKFASVTDLVGTYIKNGIDKPVVLDKKVELFKLRSLVEQLQELLATSVQSLQSNSSETNTERVLLDVLERASALLEQNVAVPAIPTSTTRVRNAVFNVFERTGRLLGRNTSEAIAADTASMLGRLKARGELDSYVGGRGSNPQEWVANHIVPKLDPDMKKSAYNVSIYRSLMHRFYLTVNEWRSRGRVGVGEFYT